MELCCPYFSVVMCGSVTLLLLRLYTSLIHTTLLKWGKSPFRNNIQEWGAGVRRGGGVGGGVEVRRVLCPGQAGV